MNGTKKLQKMPAAGKDAQISKNLLKSFDDELGNDFLSWKPSRSSATPTLDLDDGLPSKLSQKSFKMDKLDMDFDFDAGFTANLASFDIDLDFPESPLPRNITISDSEDCQNTGAPKRKEREVRTRSFVPDDTFTYKSQERNPNGDRSHDPDDTSAFRNQKRETEAKTLDSGANFMKRQERVTRSKSLDFDDTSSWRSKGDAMSVKSKDSREPADVHNQSDDETTSYGQLTSSDMQTAEELDKQKKSTDIGQVLLACRNREQKKQDLSAIANVSSERRVAEENAQMNKLNDDFDTHNENGSKHKSSESSLQKVLEENSKFQRCDPGTQDQKASSIQPSTRNSSPVGGKDADRALLTFKRDEEDLPNAVEGPGLLERRPSKDSLKSRLRSSQDGARISNSKQKKSPVPVKKTNDRNYTESATIKQPARGQQNVRSQHGVRTLASGMNSPSMVKQKIDVQPLLTYSGLAAKHGSVLGEKRNLSAALKSFVPTQVSALKTLRSLPLPPFNTEQNKGAPVNYQVDVDKERINPDTPKFLEGNNITVEENELVKGQPQRPAQRNERESLKYPPGVSDAKINSLSPAGTKMKASLLIPKSRNSRKHPSALFSLPLCKLRTSDKPEPPQAPLKTLQKPEMSVLTIKPLGVRPGGATEAHESQIHKHKTINQTALVRDNLHDIRYMQLNDEHDRTPVLLLKDATDCTTPVLIHESTDLVQTAEDYSIELDSILKVLKQRSEAAEDLLARAVVQNVQTSLLLSPIYKDKMDKLQDQIQEKLRRLQDLVTMNTTTKMTKH